jgi:hypothetical protein
MKLRLLFVITAIISSLGIAGNTISAETESETTLLPAEKPVSSSTNLHFTGRYCDECHARTPEKGKDAFLRFSGDFSQLCKCHYYKPGQYTHPVNIKPSDGKKEKIPPDFPLRKGELSCSTCHDMYLQCQYSKFKPVNRKFLRGGPYASRTTICFRCHDENKYKKRDPHNQLNAKGEIIEEKCLYCHANKPDEQTATFGDITLIGDIKMICQRCHRILEKHPAGKDHFKKPNDKILEMMKTSEIIYSIILPLDGEGTITCITCHNPHDKGVIPDEREAAKGAGEKFNNRLAGLVCNACHDVFGM